jgi:hypothetical protein
MEGLDIVARSLKKVKQPEARNAGRSRAMLETELSVEGTPDYNSAHISHFLLPSHSHLFDCF